jgi:uncharacterized OB-fold protein
MTTLREPPVSDESASFWDATRDRRFVLPWCTECGVAIWYPRLTCPRCLGSAIEWRETSGAATVYACSVHGKPGVGRVEEEGPYVVALVDLDEGVRMMTNVVECPPGDVTIGMRVVLAWEPLSDGRHLPVFRPA